MDDSNLTLRSWKRYGKDRDYVVDGSGRSLGYRDNLDGSVHVQDEGARQAVLQVLGVVPEQAAAPEPYAVALPALARDLGDNAAGAGAKALAQQHREQAPVRTLLARALGVHTEERAWRVGAKGEQTVGRELGRLGDEWTVVHDVPVGARGSNIDHVVVGPPGVFTVNSKWHAGKDVWVGGDVVMVGGHRQPYVRNARHEAQRASRLLSAAYGAHVPVLGIVAVLAQRWTVREQPRDGDVLVTAPRNARKHLQRLPRRYAVHELDRLALWARRSTTWQP